MGKDYDEDICFVEAWIYAAMSITVDSQRLVLYEAPYTF